MKSATEMARENLREGEKKTALDHIKAELDLIRNLVQQLDHTIEQERGFEIAGLSWPERRIYLQKLNQFTNETYEQFIELQKSLHKLEK